MRALGFHSVHDAGFPAQSILTAIPVVVGHFIVLFKDTMVIYVIGMLDVLKIGRACIQGNAEYSGSATELLVFLAEVFWGFTHTVSWVSLKVEEHLGWSEGEWSWCPVAPPLWRKTHPSAYRLPEAVLHPGLVQFPWYALFPAVRVLHEELYEAFCGGPFGAVPDAARLSVPVLSVPGSHWLTSGADSCVRPPRFSSLIPLPVRGCGPPPPSGLAVLAPWWRFALRLRDLSS